ncbi:MAG TPA: DegT/DnrJ/EryC1/StrS family aminotransferase [Casimicrobiaceae bacterium]|nr:DegT/DnrJ/EryC1/StrS family aminotransferase [Casimicrobiaceae bacterium]
MSIDLPVFRFDHDAGELASLCHAAERVIASRRYVLGAEVAAFEEEFAAFCRTRHCVGVANGTDALELALVALGIRAGDRVATVANAGHYTTTVLRAIGAAPVYVEVGDDLLMSVADLQRSLDDVRAVVVTHLYGRMAPIDAILGLARQAGIPVVEDCAQAHGAERGGRMAGSFGDLGCFSFYPTKNLGALGDGGAVVTSDEGLAATVRSLRQYGWSRKYCVEREGGRNSRLDEMQAAILRVKLPQLRRANAARVAIACRYREGMHDLPATIADWSAGEYVAHLFVVRCRDREALRARLAQQSIGTDVHYPVPDHRQPTEIPRKHPPMPLTESACREVLTLPCFPGMTDADVDRVIDAIRHHYADGRDD